MSDLISRSEVLELLYKIFDKYYMSTDKNPSIISKSFGTESFGIDVFKEIKKMPTAYDIDKVVEKLKKELSLAKKEKEKCTGENHLQFYSTKGYADGISYAIAVVKQGGVSEEVCEWKQTSTARYKTSCGYKLEAHFDTNACYCRQCGKKIKIVE